MAQCPLLAQSGHRLVHCKCLLLTQADIRVALAGTFNTDGTCPLTPLEGGGQPWSIKWVCRFFRWVCFAATILIVPCAAECCTSGGLRPLSSFPAQQDKNTKESRGKLPQPLARPAREHPASSRRGQLHMWPRHDTRHRVWSHTRKPRRTQSDTRKLHQARSRRRKPKRAS